MRACESLASATNLEFSMFATAGASPLIGHPLYPAGPLAPAPEGVGAGDKGIVHPRARGVNRKMAVFQAILAATFFMFRVDEPIGRIGAILYRKFAKMEEMSSVFDKRKGVFTWNNGSGPQKRD